MTSSWWISCMVGAKGGSSWQSKFVDNPKHHKIALFTQPTRKLPTRIDTMLSYSYSMIALTFLLGKGANAFQVPFLRANEDLQIDNETEGTAGNEPEGTALGDGSGDGSGTLNPQFNGCPTDVRFPEGCEILMPPFPTCSNGSYMDWMAYATESGKANCCGEDLSACTCPIKETQQ